MQISKAVAGQGIVSIRKITYAGALLALSVIFPQIVHFTGIPEAGKVLLPMHIPVLLTGFILGPVYGLIIGALSPILSFLLSGMPTAARLPFMMIELAAYGGTAGFLYYRLGWRDHRFGTYGTLLLSMLAGRIIYAISLVLAAALFGIQAGGYEAAVAATVSGTIGIVMQLLMVPPIVYAVKKGGQIDAIHGRNDRTTDSTGKENAS